MQDVFMVLIIFGTLFGIFYVYFTTRNKERLALIEKGTDAQVFNQAKKFQGEMFSLFSGMLLIGIAIGLFGSMIISNVYHIQEEPAVLMGVFFCAGLSMLLYYLIVRSQKNKKQTKPSET